MGESNTIDFETFMKQTGESKFDAKQYVEAERQKAKEIAQAQAQKKLKEQRDEHSPENTLVQKTKDAVQATESQIQYAEFAPPTKVLVKKSTIHGNGVFARENINEGELIEQVRLFRLAWRLAYQKDPVLSRYAIADNSCKCRDCAVHGPSVYMPLGYAALYNFGFDSNIRAEFDFPNLSMKIIATEDIPAGKELLFDDSALSDKITLAESLK